MTNSLIWRKVSAQEINFLPLADRKLAQFPANGLVGITIYERKKMR